MRLLADTHSFLWFAEGSPRLSVTARRLIDDPANDVFLSVVSLWEIAIKVSLQKLFLQEPFETFIPQQLVDARITLLNISVPHLNVVVKLPHHHRDPFDRMLVAQAQVEQLPIVSADPALDAYGITRQW
jgi:PIN domain nuclease of toxin-antitoxin system